jgi:SAM-dependent methyltransferase
VISMNNSIQQAYDAVPYVSAPVPASHPVHLSAIAVLLGLAAVAPRNARILEIGCARGDNIISIAQSLPGATCLGVDLSGRQVAEGMQRIADAGIKNVTLRHADIMQLAAAEPPFDYILCHGVYSWISPAAQERLLKLIAASLSPAGLAYVSYNTFPGWHMRMAIRDMMLYGARGAQDLHARPQQSRKMLEFMTSSLPARGPYNQALLQEMRFPMAMQDWYLTHDFIAEYNMPLYFETFMARCAAVGLHYVGDSDVSSMFSYDLSPQARKNMKALSLRRIEWEQHVDFLRNRQFRRTILGRHPLGDAPQFQAAALGVFHVASALTRDLQVEGAVYNHPHGGRLPGVSEVMATALSLLQELYPASMPYPALLEKTSERHSDLGSEKVAQTLGRGILNAYTAGLLELSVQGDPFSTACGPEDRPQASGWAQFQAKHSPQVTNLKCHLVELTEEERGFLQLLTGSETVNNLGGAAVIRRLAERALLVANS